MDPVTYSIKLSNTNSEDYYSDIKKFTDEVLLYAENTITPFAKEYMEYLRKYDLEKIREIEEYILELISFGILWRTYSAAALSVNLAPFITLSRMSEWRKKHQAIKPYIDFARGILITLFLLPEKRVKRIKSYPSLKNIDHVCKWFEATGEFKEQALRFVRWRAFWNSKSHEELNRILHTLEQFTSWFHDQSIIAIGKYTENVEKFINNTKEKYRWREDRVSCSRSRMEYHLNMVGAELMNRAFNAEFYDTDQKVVLLPGCMRGRQQEDCKAVRVKEGLICQGCMSQCRVNQLREMGKRNNFDVCIIPHASDLSLWAPVPGRPKRGVLASACVTTLVEGGWELKRYDVPAQCVLLDYSGCQKHWCSQSVPTELNIRELKRKIFNTTNI
jgi:hypothetical protein